MDKVRFERLKQDPRFSNRQELQENPNPRVALWLTDPGLIPLNSSGPQRHSITTQQPHAATPLPCFTAQPNPTQVTPLQSFQHRNNARNQRLRGPVGIFDNNQPWGPNYSSSNEGLDLNSLVAMMDPTNQVQQGALVQTLVKNFEVAEGSHSGAKRAGKETALRSDNQSENDGTQTLPASKKRAVEATKEASPPTQ